MGTAALVIEVVDIERAERQRYVFARSPIRVGRSPLNDLPVDRGFVSHCHGIFHFDGATVDFVDVGSTNGTFLKGERLTKNRRMPLAQGAVVEIGVLRLQVRLEQHAVEETRASYAFAMQARQTPNASPSMSARDLQQPGGGQLLERFAQSFLELRRGQSQLLRELGLPLPRRDALQDIDQASELLAYLLDPSAAPGRVDELSRAYADLMLHEVALLSAVRAGARELLEELAPEQVAPLGAGGLGWPARLLGGCLGKDARWAAYERKYDELQEETALSRALLGRCFSRAYAAALGRSDESAARAACSAGELR